MLFISIFLRQILKNNDETLICTVSRGLFKGYFISYDNSIDAFNFRKYKSGRIIPMELGLTKEQAKFKYRILMERGA